MNKLDLLCPLLIPSFSSKGSLLIKSSNGKYISDNYSLLTELGFRISKSYLLSAYDVFYGLMPENPNDWPDADCLFIDSGGYEISNGFDSHERNKFNYKVLPWDTNKLDTIHSRVLSCPKFKKSTIIFSCFDTLAPLKEQVSMAEIQLQKYPQVESELIIKITHSFHDTLSEIINDDIYFKDIPIIGVTEKELGNFVWERLLNLVSLKTHFEKIGWHGKLHVLGCLEPSLVKLYYIAGADILDGLSWQRAHYKNDASIYNPESTHVILSDYENKYLMMLENLSAIQILGNNLSTITNRLELRDRLTSFSPGETTCINDLIRYLEV